MKQHLVAGDIDGAMPYFSKASAEKYRRAFVGIGNKDMATFTSQIPSIAPVVIENDTAQCRFDT